MEDIPEIEDETFGRLSLVDGSAYFAEVPWNRGVNIRLFIHVEGENHQKFIDRAKNTFSSVRKFELELLRKGIEHLISNDVIDDSDDYKDSFIHDAAETSIEIYSNGEGQLGYLVMMLGSLIIQFSNDALFQNAQVMTG
jgi:hypothetical protein